MAKNPTRERPGRGGVQSIGTVDNPDSRNGVLFVAGLGLIVIAGIAGVVFFALNRESNVGVAPEANVDHWHNAYVINNCGAELPATGVFDNPAGLHTHGDGLLHVHPFNPSASGNNATLGEYFEAYDAELTDESFTTGITDVFPTVMSEADGCGGEDATLQLAVWRNAFDETAEPEIITENLADFALDSPGMALTLALLPVGDEPPRPPAERITALADTGAGGQIAGVAEGESPFVTTTTEPPPVEETDDAEAESTDDAEAESTEAESTEDAEAESTEDAEADG